MDDLGMIIEKVTKNRYYPYPPTMPISGSQFMLPNLIGSPYLGPYTLTNQQNVQSIPRFKENHKDGQIEEEKQDKSQKDYEEDRNNVIDSPHFKERISDVNFFPERNSTEPESKAEDLGKDHNSSNKTALELIEERILKNKLEQALKTLNDLNNDAKHLLKSKDSGDQKGMKKDESLVDLNVTQPIK